MKNLTLKHKRIILTGGSGFVGSYLLESIIKDNKIGIIDNEYRGSNISYIKKKYPLEFKKNVKIFPIDIRDKNKFESILKKFQPEIVFHLAGIAGVKTVIEKPLEVINVNLIGSYNLASIAPTIRSLKKIVYTSTSEVYGPSAFQLDEDSFTTQGTPYDSRWSYSTSKLFAEHIFVAVEREYGVSVAIARLFNIFGPRQIGSGAIHEFVKKSISNKPLIIYGDGSQIRAWCYVDDCISGLKIITKKGTGIFNIGNPDYALTSIFLAEQIMKLTKSKSKIIYKKSPYSDIQIRVPNIKKILKLGYRPKINLEKGLENTIDWYKEKQYWTSSEESSF
jgi:dTDP-glucose 4,6-dehydratase